MKKIILLLLLSVTGWVSGSFADKAIIGKKAPEFALKNGKGKPVTLSSYKGSVVVLEWTNPNCPFVVGHYGNGNMQSLQKKYKKKGVKWILINSTNKNHRDFMTVKQLKKKYDDWDSERTDILLDETGKVGKLYGAKTTPNMFIIDKKGELVYAGAIDDDRSTKGGKNAKVNYVQAALDQMLSGKKVVKSTTKPYGCSVKY